MTLSLSQQPQALRRQLAAAFPLHSTIDLSWRLGQRADTPSTAFFIAYQAAMRCLVPSLAASEWAAFLVSEKGARNPYECHTRYNTETGLLVGEKSHVMLAASGLDTAYILAKKKNTLPVELLLLKTDASDLQVSTAVKQPFMLDVPHYAVSFSIMLPATALYLTNAHPQANKPFRYWEDVHVAIALAGWLQANTAVASLALEQAVLTLMQEFKQSPGAYCLKALNALEALLDQFEGVALGLPEQQRTLWQRDSMLFKLSQFIRDKVRFSLERESRS